MLGNCLYAGKKVSELVQITYERRMVYGNASPFISWLIISVYCFLSIMNLENRTIVTPGISLRNNDTVQA